MSKSSSLAAILLALAGSAILFQNCAKNNLSQSSDLESSEFNSSLVPPPQGIAENLPSESEKRKISKDEFLDELWRLRRD